MRVFWSTLWRTLVGWIIVPAVWLLVSRQVVTDTDAWILVVWWIVVPFLAYRRAKIVVGRAEAREAERMAAIIAEGVRRGTKP